MPGKSKNSKSIAEASESASPKRRINLNFLNKINIVYVLFFLLVIASFLIGVLFTQVQFLKKGTVANTAGNDTLAGDLPTQPTGPVDVSQGALPILGNEDAKVTVVEFSDFQCPFCKSLFDETLPQLKEEYVDTGKIKFAYRHYPLSDIHPNAQKAAEASECANEQGKFWEYHDQLFENQAEWEALTSDEALEKFVEYAAAVGINGETLRECVASGRTEENVTKDFQEGLEAGVSGTPATFVNGMLISGAVPYAQFKAEIDKALEEN